MARWLFLGMVVVGHCPVDLVAVVLVASDVDFQGDVAAFRKEANPASNSLSQEYVASSCSYFTRHFMVPRICSISLSYHSTWDGKTSKTCFVQRVASSELMFILMLMDHPLVMGR
jgi:hypothetical protein